MKAREVINAVRDELYRAGIKRTRLVPGGKHMRVVWEVDGKEYFVVASRGTRLDINAAKNARKQIRKILERVA